ncbi:MAG: hypothetical protein J3R72DRAFT_433805 [Linnemannia gamsii]|nr:MAG: hypothetical protein J3R72DRAFT_433805 [Linnemannia gamsii]
MRRHFLFLFFFFFCESQIVSLFFFLLVLSLLLFPFVHSPSSPPPFYHDPFHPLPPSTRSPIHNTYTPSNSIPSLSPLPLSPTSFTSLSSATHIVVRDTSSPFYYTPQIHQSQLQQQQHRQTHTRHNMPVYSNPDALGADFLRLVNSPVGADVRLIIGEEKVMMHGHALILQTRSTYFARALTTDWKEANQGNIIHKPNIRPAIFLQILSFLYTGRLDLDETTVMDLIRAADELLLDDLLFGCERFALTTLCRDNVLEMVELACRHNLAQLKTECLDFIASNIDYLKRGKGIVKVEVEILKDILSMDQLDLDELEVWKIAVRWAYFQQGLEWETCPLVEFPKGTGCILVQPASDKEEGEGEGEEGNADNSNGSSPYRDQQKQLFGKASTGTGNSNSNINESGSDDEMTDAQVPLGGTTVHLSRHDPQDEDGFRPSSHSVFQRNTHHKVISLPISVHEELARRILPLLSSIRFLRIPSMDFLRLIEGTGLLPMYLCAKVYRHHSVPSMTDPYQPSLRRRMAFSTILSKDHKEILLEWLQAAIHGAQSGNTGSSLYGWQRSRSATANSVTTSTATSPTPARNSIVITNSSSSPPSSSPSSSLTSGVVLGNSPPAYWSRSISNNTASSTSTSTASHRLSSPAATTIASSSANNPPSALGHRSTRSGSSYSTLTHPGSFTAHSTTNANTFQQQPSSPSLTQAQHQLPQPKLTLQYRASRDGFDAHNFHMSCDQRGPTLTVVRADNGTIFGGYNSSSWSSHPSGVYSTSRVNFLFTLKGAGQLTRENCVFGIKGDGNAAAYNKADCGPTFGVGHDLFLASVSPFRFCPLYLVLLFFSCLFVSMKSGGRGE